MGKDSPKSLGVWLIRFHGLWNGFSIVADTSKKAAIRNVLIDYPRITISSAEKLRGLKFKGEPQALFGQAKSE